MFRLTLKKREGIITSLFYAIMIIGDNMKKLIAFFLLFFIPFMVKAEVKITDISFEDSNFLTEDDELPTYEGLKINTNLDFHEVEDYVEYNVTIKNDTNKDYDIEENPTYVLGDYFYYEYLLPEDITVLKSGEELSFVFVIYYAEQVPPEAYVNGIYQESNSLTLSFINDDEVAPTAEEEQPQEKNPNTKAGYYILITAIVLAIALILMLLNARNLAKLMIISLVIIIPITIYALERISVEIESTVTLRPHFYVYHYDQAISYEFELGMDFEEWLDSEYNTDDLYFEEIQTPFDCTIDGGKTGLWTKIEFEENGTIFYRDTTIFYSDTIIPNQYYEFFRTERCPV